jgi:hypothetical protein
MSLFLNACCWPASAAGGEAAAEPAPAFDLGAPFADNAILQQGMAVPVWGTSLPGAKITVTFGAQARKTVTRKHVPTSTIGIAISLRPCSHMEHASARSVRKDGTVKAPFFGS